MLYPMPAVLIGTMINNRPNFMTAAWCSIASFTPPAVAVAIQKKRYTLEGIQETKVFSVNVPSSDMAKAVDYCGIYSGRNKDKSSIFTLSYGDLKSAPLIDECPVSLECTLIESLDLGSHTLIVGEIAETYLDEECTVNNKPAALKIDPLIFVPGTLEYFKLGNVVGRAYRIGKEE
jgi:flavin reductase (DIM6/NTAB) family NADH-FMN oxidoreductase RutF